MQDLDLNQKTSPPVQRDVYKVVTDELTRLFEKGDEGSGLSSFKKDDARRLAAACMLTVMRNASLEWCILKQIKIEVLLRSDITARLDISGPVTRCEIERLKKHLD